MSADVSKITQASSRPEWMKNYDSFRIKHCPQAGRASVYFRFIKPGGKSFFLISQTHAGGSEERAWEIAVKIGDKLQAGSVQEGGLVALRDELCSAV